MVVPAVAHEELVELAHQVDRSRSVGHCGEHLRPGRDVGAASPAVRVATESHRVGIRVPHFDYRSHRGLDRLEHVTVRAADAEVHVRLHDEIPVAHVASEVW